MATEIERKFLLKDDGWKGAVSHKTEIVQAYLSKDPERTVRIRISDNEAFITIKGLPPESRPLDVPEFEYAIPVADAKNLLSHCLPGAIIKTRHLVEYAGNTWEIDTFKGENTGLVMAEIELKDAAENFVRPDWLGTEVTDDLRYKNAQLSQNPFSAWGRQKKSAVDHSSQRS